MGKRGEESSFPAQGKKPKVSIRNSRPEEKGEEDRCWKKKEKAILKRVGGGN